MVEKVGGSASILNNLWTLWTLWTNVPSVYFFRKVSIFSGKIAHSVFKEALRCFHKKFTKFTKFTHFRVGVWRFAHSNSRRRRIIVSTFRKDSRQTWMRRVTDALLCYQIIHKIVQNAEKKQFLGRFFHFFALGFAYVKNLLYLCSRKGKSFAKTQNPLHINHKNSWNSNNSYRWFVASSPSHVRPSLTLAAALPRARSGDAAISWTL